jgi:hypothetical protein
VSENESVPSVLESDATGEIAKIYADIRATLGTSVVNLVWRNLATLPGALRWTWETVRPLYLGAAAGHAQAVRQNLSLPDLRFSKSALTTAGLNQNDIGQIRAILDGYHHTNALALVVLSALLERYDPRASEALSPAASPPLVRSELPPLPAMATLSLPVQGIIATLNSYGEDEAPFLIASMYRHLAYWPEFLALIDRMLAPLQADQRLPALTLQARALGRAHGRTLSRHLMPPPPPPSLDEALASCQLFVEHSIARMTGICASIRAAMPDET